MSAEYQRYLASREWALKREAIKERSKGICERCSWFPMEQVHHLTYEHIYDEPLEDLQSICRPCHEYESGITHVDPIDLIDWWFLLQFPIEPFIARWGDQRFRYIVEKYGLDGVLDEARKAIPSLRFTDEQEASGPYKGIALPTL